MAGNKSTVHFLLTTILLLPVAQKREILNPWLAMNRFMKKLDEPKDNLKRHPCTIVEALAFYFPSERMGFLAAFNTKRGNRNP